MQGKRATGAKVGTEIYPGSKTKHSGAQPPDKDERKIPLARREGSHPPHAVQAYTWWILLTLAVLTQPGRLYLFDRDLPFNQKSPKKGLSRSISPCLSRKIRAHWITGLEKRLHLLCLSVYYCSKDLDNQISAKET